VVVLNFANIVWCFNLVFDMIFNSLHRLNGVVITVPWLSKDRDLLIPEESLLICIGGGYKARNLEAVC